MMTRHHTLAMQSVAACLAAFVFWPLVVMATARGSTSAYSATVRCRSIDSGFVVNSSTTILTSHTRRGQNRYIEYSFRYQTEKKESRLSRLGVVSERPVDAAFTLDNETILLEGCSYNRYAWSRRRRLLRHVTNGSVLDLGLPCNVDAAVTWSGDTLAFKGCSTWKLDAVTGRFQADGNASQYASPCDLDAALAFQEDEVVLVKGHQFWRADSIRGDVRLARGPFHTDELGICSWRLCGEADWMMEQPRENRTLECNGDSRLCPLRLDQVTMAGLHNAGAGFQRGFFFGNCWLRNHGLSITRQLEIGISHLDIDPCHDTCGLLGTCHSIACGGSLCVVIKQVKSFLRDNPDRVVTVNFNHEIKDAPIVFRQLIRQLKAQLGPMLNPSFRMSGNSRWPTLRDAILSNQRVFVFFAPDIEKRQYRSRYLGNPWIHSENLYGSTWRPFSSDDQCRELVPLTESRCQVRQNRQLVEVSAVPETSGYCISSMARECKRWLHEALRICQPFRFRSGRSPNVLLVDYPEVGRQEVTSVFHAVYHQNVRNVLRHRQRDCRVQIDAALLLPESEDTLFFSGRRLVTYGHQENMQTDSRLLLDDLVDINAAMPGTEEGRIVVYKDCMKWEVRVPSFIQATNATAVEGCHHGPDAAVTWQGQLWLFEGCFATLSDQTNVALGSLELPCNVDAASTSQDGDQLLVFKGNHYWRYDGQGVASLAGQVVLDWTVDVVVCQTTV